MQTRIIVSLMLYSILVLLMVGQTSEQSALSNRRDEKTIKTHHGVTEDFTEARSFIQENISVSPCVLCAYLVKNQAHR
jgi:uracil-DNA glycosylase